MAIVIRHVHGCHGNPCLGYENASRIAKQAVENGQSVRDIVLSEGLLTELELDDILSAENMTQPRRLKKNTSTTTVA